MRAWVIDGFHIERLEDHESHGVALMRLQSNPAFRPLEAGRIIESWINVTYDTERDATLRLPDDTHRVARINTDEPVVDPATGQAQQYRVGDQGDHDVTISTGPSYQSQREEAAEFLDQLIGNLQTLPVAPPQAAKLLALAMASASQSSANRSRNTPRVTSPTAGPLPTLMALSTQEGQESLPGCWN